MEVGQNVRMKLVTVQTFSTFSVSLQSQILHLDLNKEHYVSISSPNSLIVHSFRLWGAGLGEQTIINGKFCEKK